MLQFHYGVQSSLDILVLRKMWLSEKLKAWTYSWSLQIVRPASYLIEFKSNFH